MMPWSAVFAAETSKLWSRPLARVGAILFLVIGVLGPIAMSMATGSNITVNDESVSNTMDATAPAAIVWALYVRGFFTFQVVSAVLAAMSIGGELRDHTLREDLARPVPRAVVLAAKWIALVTWSAGTLLGQLVASAVVSYAMHPATGGISIGKVLTAYLASGFTEAGYLAFAVAAAVLFRSVPAAVVFVVLFLVGEWTASWVPFMVRPFVEAMDPAEVSPILRGIVDMAPFLPSSAWGAYKEFATGGTATWMPWAALLVYTGAAAALAERVFDRIDVP